MYSFKRKNASGRWSIVAILFLCAAVLISFWYLDWRKRHSQQLETLLDSLTYTHELRNDESQKLLDFKEIFTLSDREKARYYTAQNRIYCLLMGRDSLAVEAFTNGLIWAERSRDWESAAWLYADFSHIFIQHSSWKPAIECLKTSQEYAKKTQMDDSYSAYCYSLLAFIYSSLDENNIPVAKQYYKQAEPFKNTPVFQGYSVTALMDITSAQIRLRERNYKDCEQDLLNVREYIDSCPFNRSMDDLYNEPNPSWISRYLLPYYRTASILAVSQGNTAQCVELMKKGYTIFSNYDRTTNFTMRFLSGTLPAVLSADYTDSEERDALLSLSSQAALHFNELAEQSENVSGENLYQTVNASVLRINEEHQVTVLYKLILMILVIAAFVSCIFVIVLNLFHRWANIDGLTKVYNRACFDRNYLVACQKKKAFGVIMCDVDYFKQFNDTYGHAFGDTVLQKTAAAINSQLNRKTSALYRYGGDEFIIICEKCTPASLLVLAEKCEAAVMNLQFEVDTHVSLSIGTGHSSQTKDVMKLADTYVYEAKKAGRACVKGEAE